MGFYLASCKRQEAIEGSGSLLACKTYTGYCHLVFELLACFIFDKCSLAVLIKHFFLGFFFNWMILPFFYSVIITSGLPLSAGLRYKLDYFSF